MHRSGAVDRPTSLEDLYRDHFAALMRVAFLLSDSAAAAEDAVHEVFVRCAPRLDALAHPPSYLRTAVVNECRSVHRRRRRVDTVLVDTVDELPHDLLETRAALAQLPDRQRAAVVLRYFVDLPDPEIAKILGCRPVTVRTLLHRAVQTLREALS